MLCAATIGAGDKEKGKGDMLGEERALNRDGVSKKREATKEGQDAGYMCRRRGVETWRIKKDGATTKCSAISTWPPLPCAGECCKRTG